MYDDITQSREYADYCEFAAIRLFHALNRLKIEKTNEETVNHFLKNNKIKRKLYEKSLDELYAKCELLMMRYSDDLDIAKAYKEIDGDNQARWFFNIVYKAFVNKVCISNINSMIEKIYKIPVYTVIWMRISS